MRTISIDQPALEAVYTQAQQLHPDQSTGWGRAIRVAYERLMDLWADEGTVQFDAAAALHIESATQPGVVYRANGGCTCDAGRFAAERGLVCLCHHRAMRQLVVRMLDLQGPKPAQLRPNEGIYTVTLPARPSRAAEALSGVLELF